LNSDRQYYQQVVFVASTARVNELTGDLYRWLSNKVEQSFDLFCGAVTADRSFLVLSQETTPISSK
jgi:hypothetical protein